MSIPLIYNRDGDVGDNGWVHIVPKGELPNEEAGIVQVMDDIGLRSIVSSFNAEKARLGDRFPGLYFGVEHHLYDPSQSSEALGWAKELELRANGVWARLEPTDIGATAILNRRFKYTSFVADPKHTEPLSGNRRRIMQVDSVGLTNLPNGKNLLVPIANRADESPKPNRDVQDRAAQHIAQLAVAEQRASGVSLGQAWERVLNRNSGLADVARGRGVSTGAKAEAREVVEDAAGFAGRAVLRLAQSREMPGMAANLRYVRNRFPRLARMENREGWDVLKELEPEAHKTYMDAAQQPRGDAQPESRWNGFFEMVDAVKQEIPDLGYEGVWQKLRELYPATFLKFVLSFDDQEGSSDLLAPAPKTEEERYREKRARITLAANTEFKRYGRNGRGPQKMAENTVSEALAAL